MARGNPAIYAKNEGFTDLLGYFRARFPLANLTPFLGDEGEVTGELVMRMRAVIKQYEPDLSRRERWVRAALEQHVGELRAREVETTC